MESNKGLRVFKMDPDIAVEARRVSNAETSLLHQLANEPVHGLHSTKEHIKRTVPLIVDCRTEMTRQGQAIEESAEDLDYSVLAVKTMPDVPTFRDIKALLQKSILHAETMLSSESAPRSRATSGQEGPRSRVSSTASDKFIPAPLLPASGSSTTASTGVSMGSALPPRVSTASGTAAGTTGPGGRDDDGDLVFKKF
eukprot:TRINITY_DN2981_c0_g1_i3.p1 TRINITY_DN2981_c0_g1~~TRINITY_DN2981_c0_g1_i3.p1  ORF type:complete len:197 (-),score=30.59 TRINITY_DN2981_c0_g1_i3:60-650(-)